MKRIIINGKFMSEGMQGIVRYAREVISALDKQLKKGDRVWLVVPKNAKDIPDYEHIRVITYGSRTGILWEQTELRRFAAFYKDSILLNLCNTAPFFIKNSVTTVHDIMYKVCADYYTTPRNRLSRLWHCLQYSYLFRHEKRMITVSEYSRNDIEKRYPAAKGKTVVIGNGWQHVLSYKENENWQEKFPQLKAGEYFFSLATLAKNKNGRWIMETAKRNPQLTFAMAGRIYETEYDELPPNVHLLGFVEDEDACALLKHCRAFLFPSLYEGFGIPPVEALALGAEVISSDRTSLPEVLGKSVHYIDPTVYDYDLEELLSQPCEDRNAVLDRYGWDKSAAKLLALLKEL